MFTPLFDLRGCSWLYKCSRVSRVSVSELLRLPVMGDAHTGPTPPGAAHRPRGQNVMPRQALQSRITDLPRIECSVCERRSAMRRVHQRLLETKQRNYNIIEK